MKTIEIHHFFTHDMRWEDNTALSRAILCAAKLCDNENDQIRIKGWICLDPHQISNLSNNAKSESAKLHYRGIPGAITFM